MFLKKELLRSDLRSGEVYINDLFSNTNFQISKLTIKPNAQIVKHSHSIDNEVYFIYEKGKEVRVELYKKGEPHCLKNDSNNDMTVFSVKCR